MSKINTIESGLTSYNFFEGNHGDKTIYHTKNRDQILKYARRFLLQLLNEKYAVFGVYPVLLAELSDEDRSVLKNLCLEDVDIPDDELYVLKMIGPDGDSFNEEVHAYQYLDDYHYPQLLE